MGTVPKKVRKKSLSLEAGVLLQSNNDPFYSFFTEMISFSASDSEQFNGEMPN